MFPFDLKKTQTVTMALLLLCVSIWPHSCYPHTEEDEDLPELEEKLDNDEDLESVHDDDDEDDDLEKQEEEEDGTSAATETIAYCITVGRPCDSSANPDGLPCCTNQYGDFYECGSYNGVNCINIIDDEIQNELQKLKLEEIMKMKPAGVNKEKPEEVKKREKTCDWYCSKTPRDRTGFRFLTPYCPC